MAEVQNCIEWSETWWQVVLLGAFLGFMTGGIVIGAIATASARRQTKRLQHMLADAHMTRVAGAMPNGDWE